MREMKDSGIDWLGKIPADWNIKRLKQILQERNEKNNPIKSTNLLSLSIERGVFPYSEKTGGGNKAKENFEDYKLTYPNDIVLNSMNVVVGAVGKSNYFGCISPVYYTLFSRNDNYNIDYYNDIFQSEAFQKSLWGLGNGIVVKESDNGKLNTIRMRIPMEKLNNVLLPVPTREEQDKIDEFLNGKITEIDNVIAKTKQTIDDYKLYKQSIITKAVTKGLDETVEMKDSGIEWIGRIPKHWNLKKLKFSSKTRNEKYNKRFGNLEYFALENIASGDAEFVKTNNQYSLDGTMICEKDDVVFGKLRPYLAKLYKSPKRQCCSSEFAIFYDFEGISDYYKYLFLTHWFINVVDASTYGTKMPRANIEYLNNMIIPIPNIEEQIEIVKYIENKIIEINKLIKNKEKLIIELEKYEKSIIYEYVTGKKEVREKKFNNTDNINGIKINCKDNIFAQAILLCKIIEKLRNYNLGRVKAEKTLYLIEKEVGFDFNNKYVREAAGPLSENLYKCESIISKNKWVNIKKVKKYIEYEMLPNFNKYSKYYDKYYSSYDSQIEKIIDIVKNYSTDKAEMVATLYAAWNDFIIKKDKVSDIEIVKDVRENWNDRKKRFNEKEWLEVLEEMKQNGLTPKGNGNLTIIKE